MQAQALSHDAVYRAPVETAAEGRGLWLPAAGRLLRPVLRWARGEIDWWLTACEDQAVVRSDGEVRTNLDALHVLGGR